MKISALTKIMNDYGTKPKIRVLKHCNSNTVIVYEGRPDNISIEIANMKVNSFTVLGVGYIEIHTQ